MPRYIDAEELLKHKRKVMIFGISCEDDSWDYAVLEENIINVPTADVVEVVRCKDCKWLIVGGLCCKNIKGGGHKKLNPDDYCSYGERKDGEGE